MDVDNKSKTYQKPGGETESEAQGPLANEAMYFDIEPYDERELIGFDDVRFCI